MTTGHPARFPVVARHLDPDRASHLTSILAGRTALRVTEAADGNELTPGARCGGTVFGQDELTRIACAVLGTADNPAFSPPSGGYPE